MLRRFSSTRCAAIAVTAGALAAAGCTTSGQPSHPAAKSPGTAGPASAPSSSLTAAHAIRLAAEHAQQVTSFGATISLRGTGAQNVSVAGTIRERTQPSPLLAADLPTVSAQGQALPGGVQEMVTSSAIYLKMAELARETGKPWLEIPASQVSKVTGASFGQLLQQDNTNPLVRTEMLASSKNVQKVGTATVDGVATTEYTGTYPLSAGLARLPATVRAKVAPQLQSLGLHSENFRIWLDGKQQVRKVVVSDQGSREQMTSTIEVTAIDQPVSAVAPPAAQTAVVPAGKLGS